MNTPYYPAIDEAYFVPLNALKAQLEKTPELLTSSDCPYSPAVRRLVAEFVGGLARSAAVEGLDLDNIDTLEGEIGQLYKDVKTLANGLQGSTDKDVVQLYRTTASLLEKLLNMRGEVLNMKNMQDFKKRVIDVLDNLITPEQRAEFIEKLGLEA
jgi:hypothetical protein